MTPELGRTFALFRFTRRHKRRRTGATVGLVGFGANFGATMDGHDVHRTSSVRHRCSYPVGGISLDQLLVSGLRQERAFTSLDILNRPSRNIEALFVEVIAEFRKG